MRWTAGFCVLLMALVCFASDERGLDLKSLYQAHQWFKLRDAVSAKSAPAFYRGAAACAFNDLPEAENSFQEVIASAPQSEQAYESHDLLTNAYIRAGRYRQALAQLEKMMAIKPEGADTRNALPVFAALSRYPDQSVTQRHSSTLRYKMKDGNLLIPLLVNEKAASYIVDTGANFCLISAGEAKRLGLTIQEGTSTGSDSAGVEFLGQTAVAAEIAVGEIHLTNVAFVVIGDGRQLFFDLAPGERGVIGLPVLLALETLRWSTDGSIEIGFPSQLRSIDESNICFDGMTPITEAGFLQSKLNLVLDTAATSSHLWPGFAKEFPSVVNKSGKKGSRRVSGVAGSVKVKTITLPELKFRLGGFDIVLRPAHVELKPTASDNQWYDGSVGLDLFNQARRVTIDFKVLKLVLE